MSTPPGPPGLITRRLNLIVLALSLVAIALAVYSDLRAREYNRCQAQVNEVLIERTRILSDVGARERAAERARDDALDATFLDPSAGKPPAARTPADQQRLLRLFAVYQEAARTVAVERAAADKARADNPVPPTPSALCG